MNVPSKLFNHAGFMVLGNDVEIRNRVAVSVARRGTPVVCGLSREELISDIYEREGISIVRAEMSETGIKHLFDQSVERLANLSVLIHCMFAPEMSGQSLIETSRSEWDRMMSVYLREPFLASQNAIQEFLAAGKGGRIILVLSAPSDNTTSKVGYAVVQSALYGLIRSIAKEYGRRGIFCNAVSICGASDQESDSSTSHDMVAETILFLASDEASFVNGEIIPVTASVRTAHRFDGESYAQGQVRNS